jgi:pyruvate-ferredoxin/flavodoxin oxidoreductase
MAEKTDEWSALGRKNIFGQEVSLVEMQSEAGAIGVLHGALEAGAYATSYTSSQGLLLMLPTMHRIAGSRLPAVLHVASRTVGTHAMSIFGDHSDVMNCRPTGFAMLSSASVQEAADLAAVAHLTAIKCRMAVMHFFDGFRTSHEMQKVELPDYEILSGMVDWEAIKRFRAGSLNPEHPTLRNTVQNPDVYFQSREANNIYYDRIPQVFEEYMREIGKATGREYNLFDYYGAADAERVIIAMGSVGGTAREVVEALNARGEKVGFIQVHLYRPFSTKHFLAALPKTAKVISVLDRTKESGAIGEPLYQDICAVFAGAESRPIILGGRYGLSSKDTTPSQIKAVFDNMKAEPPQDHFTIGIVDDVSFLSLQEDEADTIQYTDGVINCKFWGLGSDGTVGANKNSIKIIGENTDMSVQAYFEYDTKKSYGVTKSHLRFGKREILSSYLVKKADFVACHNQSYLKIYEILPELKPKGVFLLNCDRGEEGLDEVMPAHVRRYIAENDISFYIIDAGGIARGVGLGERANIVLQAAFFKLSGIIEADKVKSLMENAVRETYRRKGEELVALNIKAINAGMDGVRKVSVPDAWRTLDVPEPEGGDGQAGHPDFIKNVLIPINAQKGDGLPVSALLPYSDGTMPLGTTAYEKRGMSLWLPVWEKENCAQCNRCALVCSHAVIRPYLLDEGEAKAAPPGFETVPAVGGKAAGMAYSIQISDPDCTGCGSCVSVCPAKTKALRIVPAGEKDTDSAHWEYGLRISEKADAVDRKTVKGSQFRQPLCEFSGACGGCGETPYAKLLTQLFGDRMYWANATGCSQAWGAAMPSIPYTVNNRGHGPAWSNSLFENNAEFSLGLLLAERQQRSKARILAAKLKDILPESAEGDAGAAGDADGSAIGKSVAVALAGWLDAFEDIDKSYEASMRLEPLLRGMAASGDGEAASLAREILSKKEFLSKKTVWMYGGDGWAYDIGYGGLDHVVAMGEDMNVLIVDTEVYSNTGGQSSKATPLGAVAQFQSSGKKSPKKDLGRQLMSYGNVYVASVSMGADAGQLIKAIVEAESYNGPSVIIAYAPCIAHGIKAGMSQAQNEMKRAVESGYWPLYRYDPRRENPFQMDSKEPKLSYQEFLDGEDRYASLKISFPHNAEELFAEAERKAKESIKEYQKMGGQGSPRQ